MLTFPEQVGQLLVIGFEGALWDYSLENLLSRTYPGGVIFFQRNVQTAQEFQKLVGQIRRHLFSRPFAPPFLAMDLEGGTVDRLRDAVAPLPAARDVAQAGLAAEMGRLAGRELAAFSLNVDFAPVMDLAAPESQDVLGNRTAGESPEQVLRFAENFLAGLAESGGVGCGKHFPGLGGAGKDSHRELPCIRKDEAEMWEEDLFPFRALASRLPLMMVGHAWYPRLEAPLSATSEIAGGRPLPASLSSQIVSGLLKGKMGYKGLVLSDDLEMGAILQNRPMEEAAVAALRAGCDMLLVCRDPGNVRKAFEALRREAGRNAGFRILVEQAAEKVILAKKNLRINPQPITATSPDWEMLRREIREFAVNVQRQLSFKPGRAEGAE